MVRGGGVASVSFRVAGALRCGQGARRRAQTAIGSADGLRNQGEIFEAAVGTNRVHVDSSTLHPRQV